ncbi:MAG TPA: ABC transporter permease [Acidimicrobiales bacterium]|nr:ABC transporter permease [Acidimicrobiales bacterium]
MPTTEVETAVDEVEEAPRRPGTRLFAGLDNLEVAEGPTTSRARHLWSATWPKLAAIAIGLFLWQCVVWSGWRPDYLLPGPGTVFSQLWEYLQEGRLQDAMLITFERAIKGYALAMVIGVVLGSLVARIKVLRVAFGSLITGIQTMPSIAWFPLAILLFQLSERAIMFVVVIGAAPSIANGLISGSDNIPPILLRAGHALGARGLSAYRHIVLPASLPYFVGGMKQGWAFAWRSLMAGELLVVIAGQESIGVLLQTNRNLQNSEGLLATMIAILVIGIIVDSAFFANLDRAIRRRWGLTDPGGL